MPNPTMWRKIVDATKAEISNGPSDSASVNRRIRELRRGGPAGFANQAIEQALYELGVESRASA